MIRLEKEDELLGNLELICDALYHNNMANAMEQVPKVMLEIVTRIEDMVNRGMDVELLKELSNSLERVNNGWNEKDHVYIADVLTFEIVPYLKESSTR